MTDLRGTVWKSKASGAHVRVSDNGPTHAVVQPCDEHGKVWYTFGNGGLASRQRRVQLTADGSRLKRYEQVAQVVA